MWPFTVKLAKTGLLTGFTDFHCHLLPGVDDGIKRMKDTLLMLDYYEKVGIKEVWFTPHIMEDVPNTTEFLKSRFEEVKTEYKGGLSLNLAAEYMLDNVFEERLAANDLLLHGDAQDQILVETSYFNGPMDLHDILKRIMASGVFPLLAHPERYVYMDYDEYKELKEMGVRFQLNIPSVCGMYGNHVLEKAWWLLEHDMYDVIGSDTHRTSARMGDFVIKKKLAKKMFECRG